MLFRIKSYINIPMLLRIIGWLLLIEAAFMMIPIIVSLIYNQDDLFAFTISAGITILAGVILMSIKPKYKDLGKREAILLTALTWIVLSIFGMLPFLFSGVHKTITDAFFETMSGFTTTGMSAIDSLENIPAGVIIWRCVVQWVGGMGIILFTLAVLPMLNHQGGMQLFNAEVTGITHDKLRPRVSSTAKGLWIIYISLTAVLILLLSFSEMSLFDAICHGLSTMSTGGFSTVDGGIGTWNTDYVKIVICIFMFLGGVNFAMLYNLSNGKIKYAKSNDPLKWYVILILISSLILSLYSIFQGNAKTVSEYILDPIFQTVSIMSSTGITDPEISHWGELSFYVLTALTFIGACAGSTSGGSKIDRIIILFKFIKNEFYKMMHPNAVTTVRINGVGTSSIVVQKAIAFLFLYIIVIIFGGIILMLLGVPSDNSFLYSLHAISNTGVTINFNTEIMDVGITQYAVKWVLAFIMLVGRLELYTILLLFTTSFWRK